jgi:hypothetical protein
MKSVRNIQKSEIKKWNQVSTKDLIHAHVVLLQKTSMANLAKARG